MVLALSLLLWRLLVLSQLRLRTQSTSSITGSQTGITVTHAAAVANVVISPAGSSVTAGASVTYSATASDAYGNTWDVTSSTTWSISSGAGGSWSSNVYTSAYCWFLDSYRNLRFNGLHYWFDG